MKTFKQYRQMNEGPAWDAAKEGLKDPVAWGLIAAPVPGSMPLGIAKMAHKALRAYKKKKTISEEFRRDNPGGRWLAGHRERAEKSGRKISGPVTGYHSSPVRISTNRLHRVPGAEGEHRYRDNSRKLQELEKTIGHPSKFDSQKHPVVVGVNHRGEGYVIEGNHRIAYARKHKIPHVHAEVRYYAGGEEVKGPYHPSKFR